jgi:hypothetical protein
MRNEHERDQDEQGPYWNAEARLGTLRLPNQEEVELHLEAHVAPEHPLTVGDELIPLPRQDRRGYVYVQGRPYIQEPDIRLTLALDPDAGPGDPIGAVVGSEWAGMRRRVVGSAQAWCYPGERTIILWECYLFEQHRLADSPAEDANLRACWRGFERFLVGRFPDARRFVTTHDDPLYDTAEYQRFLADLGYRRYSPRAFEKETPRR